MIEDRFNRMEREHEERQKAAESLAGMLGIGAETKTEAKPAGEDGPRDEGGRFVAGPADAGEKGAPVLPRPSMGHLIMAHIDDDPSHLQ